MTGRSRRPGASAPAAIPAPGDRHHRRSSAHPGQPRQRYDGMDGPPVLKRRRLLTDAQKRARATEPLAPLERDPAAMESLRAFQALVRHHQRPVQVREIEGGIVHTAIRGDADVLAAVGIPGISSPGPKEVRVFRLPPGFGGAVVGGERRYELKGMTGATMLDEILSPDGRTVGILVAINGGFYNSRQKASEQHSPHASIGASVIPGADVPPHLDPHEHYVADYVFDAYGETGLSVAPLLSENGELRFGPDRLDDPRYRFSDAKNQPGCLAHASHPNARMATVRPTAANESDDPVRLVIVLNPGNQRRQHGRGFTLPELAAFTARLERMNAGPSRSVNHDGGNSARLVILRPDGRKLLELTPTIKKTSGAANFVVFREDGVA